MTQDNNQINPDAQSRQVAVSGSVTCATDFRIGNYISHPRSECDTITEIGFKNIKEDSREFYFRFENTHEGYFADACKPIEITEKWLEKLGFENSEDTPYRWFILDGSLAYDIDDNCIRVSDSWEFGTRKYVHELQNLFFSLTGRELTDR